MYCIMHCIVSLVLHVLYGMKRKCIIASTLIPARLAQPIECLIVEQEGLGLIPGAGIIIRVFKKLRNEGSAFSCPANS